MFAALMGAAFPWILIGPMAAFACAFFGRREK